MKFELELEVNGGLNFRDLAIQKINDSLKFKVYRNYTYNHYNHI